MSFYKLDGGTMMVAPTLVSFGDRDLVAADRATYTYPVRGWTWYDTEDEAFAALGRNADEDTQIVVKNNAGVRLFGIRFDSHGVQVVNFTANPVRLDGSGGVPTTTDVTLAAGASRYVALTVPFRADP